MRLSDRFPNYFSALMLLIEDKRPIKASNDSMLLCYYIGLANMNNGFDYYELVQNSDGSVFFRVRTMLGLKTYLETRSHNLIESKYMSENGWVNLISDTSIKHFLREEYKGLKHGYIKKGQAGCFGAASVIAIIITLGVIITTQ